MIIAENMKNYSNYTTEDYLSDLFFMDWIYKKDKEGDVFFSQLIKAYPHTKAYIEEAKSILLKVQIEVPQISKEEIDESWLHFTQAVDKHQQVKINRHRKIIRWSISVASIALIILSISLFNRVHLSENPDYISLINKDFPVNDSDEIQLILSENETWTIQKNNQISYKNGYVIVSEFIEGSENIVIQRKLNKKDPLNKIIVPRGKRTNLLLSDGSKIWINSESTVIYPAVFNNENREIFVDGEVFLDVTPDKTKKFIAKTHQIDIAVLGTSFNVSAYSEDEEQSVVLVSGKVEITNREKEQRVLLTPNERYRQTGNNIGKVDKVNAIDYSCWKDGLMNVDSESLANVLKRLERYYNVPILYDENQDIYLKCKGKLQLTDDIQFVLANIESAAPIKFVKEANKYVVK